MVNKAVREVKVDSQVGIMGSRSGHGTSDLRVGWSAVKESGSRMVLFLRHFLLTSTIQRAFPPLCILAPPAVLVRGQNGSPGVKERDQVHLT